MLFVLALSDFRFLFSSLLFFFSSPLLSSLLQSSALSTAELSPSPGDLAHHSPLLQELSEQNAALNEEVAALLEEVAALREEVAVGGEEQPEI